MDAFFAAVEQRDQPKLRRKPLIIGGSPDSRGVVCTCSYEARAFGVRSAMPSYRAKELCPQGIFLPPNIDKYRAESAAIFEIFRRFTPLVEGVSIDEAYLDVTENSLNTPSATLVAVAIRQAIYKERNLTASAGVSYNKFLAKVASDLRKPDGLSVIPPNRAKQFLENLPIEKFHGIGKVTASRFKKMGVRSGKELLLLDRQILKDNFGKAGLFFYDIVRGKDERQVECFHERKSFGRETTFKQDIQDINEIKSTIEKLSLRVSELLFASKSCGKTINIKLKYADFKTITRALTLPKAVDNYDAIKAAALTLLARLTLENKPIRLVGVSVSNLTTEPPPEAIQLELDLKIPENSF